MAGQRELWPQALPASPSGAEITVWFDGCCEPRNPGGNAGFGAAIYEGDHLLAELSGFVPAAPTTSNNVAEYLAFCAALDWLREHGMEGRTINVYGDSRLVIEQMLGHWRIREGFYVDTAHRARKLLSFFPAVSLQWIPREQNERADHLSKRELLSRGIEFKIQPEGGESMKSSANHRAIGKRG